MDRNRKATTKARTATSKIKGWKELKDHAERYANVSYLGSELPLSEETVKTAERYISSLYTISARARATADAGLQPIG